MTQTKNVLRIAAVDDHDIVLRGLAALTQVPGSGLELVATATSSAGIVEALQGKEVDVAILDLSYDNGEEFDQVIEAVRPWTRRVLIYTATLRPVPIRRALMAGADGVALKTDSDQNIIDAVKSVANGDFAVSSELAYVLATDEDLMPHLAPRELEALKLMSQGVPRKLVGKRMNPPVEESTVCTYLNRVSKRYAALGREVSSSHDVVREARRDGYLAD